MIEWCNSSLNLFHFIQKRIDGAPVEKELPDDSGNRVNIPQPKRYVVDPNNPIYKHEANQPGEKGKPVNVKKEVPNQHP